MAATISGASLQGIYNRLNAIPQYHPMDAQTFADWSVEAGDVVTVSRGEESYSSPVSTARMVWRGAPEIRLASTGNKQRNPVSTESQRKYKRGSAARRTQEIIQSTLEDEVDGVRSSVTQMANQWSVVVEGTGQNAHIKPAVIEASINAATEESKIFLSAHKIELDGNAVAAALQSQNIQVQQLTVTGDLIVEDEGGITTGAIDAYYGDITELYVGEGYNKLNIYDVTISGNTLTVWYVDGSHQSFSKATSLSPGWSGEIGADTGRTYTVSALPANVGIDPVELKLYDGNFHNFTGTWDGNKYTGKIVYSIPAGVITQYADTGLRYEVDVTNKLQEKTVTPTGSQQTVTPDNGYIGLSSVVVEAGGGGSVTLNGEWDNNTYTVSASPAGTADPVSVTPNVHYISGNTATLNTYVATYDTSQQAWDDHGEAVKGYLVQNGDYVELNNLNVPHDQEHPGVVTFAKIQAGGGGSGTITTVTGTAIDEHQPEYSGTMTVSGTNITNSPYEVGIGINHSTFIPQGASSAVPCVNILHGDTVIARQDVTVSAKTPTFTYNASTHKYTASTKAMAWGAEYGNAITADSGTEAYDSFDIGAYTLYVYDENGYSPSPKYYTLTSGSGSSAVCNMGVIIKNSKNTTTKTFTFNAPVTYAYRDGYEAGKSAKLVTDDIQIDSYSDVEKGTNAPSLKNAISHAQNEKTWLSFRVYIKGTSPLVQKYYKMNFTKG